MKRIKCTQLQYDYRGIKSDDRYQMFTEFYNRMNTNYRMLVEQKTINSVRIFKNKTNHMDRRNDRNNGGQGGHGRVRFCGRGSGGLYFAESMDVEDKVNKAKVAVVDMDEDDIMETKGITLTLTFPAYRTILT